jgi:opacity protein-like surface antigen
MLVCVSAAVAAPADKPLKWYFDTGWSPVAGDTGDVISDGWMIGFGAFYQWNPQVPFQWRFDLTYDWWDVNTGNLDTTSSVPGSELRIDDGDASQWSARAGLQWDSHGNRARLALGGGVGAYHEYANVSTTVLIPGYICDPYYWWYCYPGLVAGDAIVDDESVTKLGYYASAGIVFPLRTSEMFVEVQYHWVQLEKYFSTYPVVIGWRF